MSVFPSGTVNPVAGTLRDVLSSTVLQLSKALAKSVVDKGIVVNCVSPGMVSPSNHLDIEYTVKTDKCYAERTGSDRENADLICFLASEKNGYVVGQNIQIDGCRKLL